MAPVDLAHQILARDRHVLRVAGAEEVVTFVGAGAAADASVQIDPQRTGTAQQLIEFLDGLVVPALDQLAGKAQRLLMLRRRLEGAEMPRGAFGELRRLGVFLERGDIEVGHDLFARRF
jgi:hypothetical protein